MTDFTFYTMENAPQPVQEIFSGIQQTYGFIPNLFAYMAEAPTTLKAYLTLNELISETSLSAAQQQVALLAVSVENECDFCTVAHHAIGKMKKANENTLTSARAQTEIKDPQDRALVTFTQAITKNRGNINEAEIDAFLNAGFTKQQILEVILIISIKTLSNYINHLTHPKPNQELIDMI